MHGVLTSSAHQVINRKGRSGKSNLIHSTISYSNVSDCLFFFLFFLSVFKWSSSQNSQIVHVLRDPFNLFSVLWLKKLYISFVIFWGRLNKIHPHSCFPKQLYDLTWILKKKKKRHFLWYTCQWSHSHCFYFANMQITDTERYWKKTNGYPCSLTNSASTFLFYIPQSPDQVSE